MKDKKYLILRSLVCSINEILILSDFSLSEIANITRSFDKFIKKIEVFIRPEEVLLFDIIKLAQEFKEKFNLEMKVILPCDREDAIKQCQEKE